MIKVLMVLGFIWWWPVGLALLGLILARRRHGAGPMLAGDGVMMQGCEPGDRWGRKIARAQEKVERVRNSMERYYGRGNWMGASSSGNRAFDDYRSETLRRLEDEQREFKDFLDRLRVAKDRAEFDQFMADRRRAANEPPSEPQPPANG